MFDWPMVKNDQFTCRCQPCLLSLLNSSSKYGFEDPPQSIGNVNGGVDINLKRVVMTLDPPMLPDTIYDHMHLGLKDLFPTLHNTLQFRSYTLSNPIRL